ncbi:type II secretion system protein [uncultured Desulfosarcina sp.]|uniref:type II secretion system protein n=1 Tax=uncultured Desulfosarcina sp. TaxID=218289 RepID=UPI0029C93CA2|nr:type II secretion system protein [uncultured Desulfosarcina sp.]
MNNQKGFTLIELIVVIVVLGILAAFALPRFIDVTSDARAATVNACAGSVRAAVALARAQYMADGNATATTVTMDGTAVTCNASTGIPVATAAGIGAALQSTDGYTITYGTGTATFEPESTASGTCQAVYDGTTGVVTVDTTGC